MEVFASRWLGGIFPLLRTMVFILFSSWWRKIISRRNVCHAQASLVLDKIVDGAERVQVTEASYTLLPPPPPPPAPPPVLLWSPDKEECWRQPWTRRQIASIWVPFCHTLAMVAGERPIADPQFLQLWWWCQPSCPSPGVLKGSNEMVCLKVICKIRRAIKVQNHSIVLIALRGEFSPSVSLQYIRAFT